MLLYSCEGSGLRCEANFGIMAIGKAENTTEGMLPCETITMITCRILMQRHSDGSPSRHYNDAAAKERRRKKELEKKS